MKYLAQFYGRRIGAIGLTYPITATTEGETPDAARLALYDQWEHIQGLRLTPQPEAQPQGRPATGPRAQVSAEWRAAMEDAGLRTDRPGKVDPS